MVVSTSTKKNILSQIDEIIPSPADILFCILCKE